LIFSFQYSMKQYILAGKGSRRCGHFFCRQAHTNFRFNLHTADYFVTRHMQIVYFRIFLFPIMNFYCKFHVKLFPLRVWKTLWKLFKTMPFCPVLNLISKDILFTTPFYFYSRNYYRLYMHSAYTDKFCKKLCKKDEKTLPSQSHRERSQLFKSFLNYLHLLGIA
jgi:hypothetical protein